MITMEVHSVRPASRPPRNISCPLCHRSFATRAALEDHSQASHTHASPAQIPLLLVPVAQAVVRNYQNAPVRLSATLSATLFHFCITACKAVWPRTMAPKLCFLSFKGSPSPLQVRVCLGKSLLPQTERQRASMDGLY